MKGQWGLILGLIVALIIAIFSVTNMEVVTVHYIFGTGKWPLVLVIISSVLMGAILVGAGGAYGLYKLRNEIKVLQEENNRLSNQLYNDEQN